MPEDVESTLPDDAPRITLPVFEGPLDLLLYLIRRDKIDIHDIPIAPITRQYMEYLDADEGAEPRRGRGVHGDGGHPHPHQVEDAGAGGAHRGGGEEEGVDPREELVRRLLEFQRYKEAAGILHQQAQIRAATWPAPRRRPAEVRRRAARRCWRPASST